MNRRHFLSALATVAAGAVLDPERLLWVPGKKTIFLPTIAPASAMPYSPRVFEVIRPGAVFALGEFDDFEVLPNGWVNVLRSKDNQPLKPQYPTLGDALRASSDADRHPRLVYKLPPDLP